MFNEFNNITYRNEKLNSNNISVNNIKEVVTAKEEKVNSGNNNTKYTEYGEKDRNHIKASKITKVLISSLVVVVAAVYGVSIFALPESVVNNIFFRNNDELLTVEVDFEKVYYDEDLTLSISNDFDSKELDIYEYLIFPEDYNYEENMIIDEVEHEEDKMPHYGYKNVKAIVTVDDIKTDVRYTVKIKSKDQTIYAKDYSPYINVSQTTLGEVFFESNIDNNRNIIYFSGYFEKYNPYEDVKILISSIGYHDNVLSQREYDIKEFIEANESETDEVYFFGEIETEIYEKIIIQLVSVTTIYYIETIENEVIHTSIENFECYNEDNVIFVNASFNDYNYNDGILLKIHSSNFNKTIEVNDYIDGNSLNYEISVDYGMYYEITITSYYGINQLQEVFIEEEGIEHTSLTSFDCYNDGTNIYIEAEFEEYNYDDNLIITVIKQTVSGVMSPNNNDNQVIRFRPRICSVEYNDVSETVYSVNEYVTDNAVSIIYEAEYGYNFKIILSSDYGINEVRNVIVEDSSLTVHTTVDYFEVNKELNILYISGELSDYDISDNLKVTIVGGDIDVTLEIDSYVSDNVLDMEYAVEYGYTYSVTLSSDYGINEIREITIEDMSANVTSVSEMTLEGVGGKLSLLLIFDNYNSNDEVKLHVYDSESIDEVYVINESISVDYDINENVIYVYSEEKEGFTIGATAYFDVIVGGDIIKSTSITIVSELSSVIENVETYVTEGEVYSDLSITAIFSTFSQDDGLYLDLLGDDYHETITLEDKVLEISDGWTFSATINEIPKNIAVTLSITNGETSLYEAIVYMDNVESTVYSFEGSGLDGNIIFNLIFNEYYDYEDLKLEIVQSSDDSVFNSIILNDYITDILCDDEETRKGYIANLDGFSTESDYVVRLMYNDRVLASIMIIMETSPLSVVESFDVTIDNDIVNVNIVFSNYDSNDNLVLIINGNDYDMKYYINDSVQFVSNPAGEYYEYNLELTDLDVEAQYYFGIMKGSIVVDQRFINE